MSAPLYSVADYLAALQALMPRGRVWSKDPSSVQSQALACFVPTFVRSNQAANNLLVDAFPATADSLLPEWESTLGLPDPCAGPSPTLQQRQDQVVARLTNAGGQSIPFFVGYAKSLGYSVTITQFTPFRVGQQRAGDAVGIVDWAFAWRVNAPASTVVYFTAGRGTAGQPLASWGNEVLQCELTEIKPAHTEVLFAYGTPGTLDGTFILGESSLS
jgi:uncharacterized protein YmfQ (DUF2313 family)